MGNSSEVQDIRGKSLGQIACEVYIKGRYDITDSSNWWEKLPALERESWEAAADAAVFESRRRENEALVNAINKMQVYNMQNIYGDLHDYRS